MERALSYVFAGLTIVGVVVSIFFYNRFLSFDPTSSMRARGLIIFETINAEDELRPWTLRVVTKALEDNRTSVVFSGYAPKTENEDPDKWSPQSASLMVSFVGPGMESTSCEGIELQKILYGELEETVQQVIKADLNADGPASALAQSDDYIKRISKNAESSDNSRNPEDIFSSLADREIQVVQAKVHLWADERNAWDRKGRIIESGEKQTEFIFAQECQIPSSSVWDLGSDQEWPTSIYSSFLPPQMSLVTPSVATNAQLERLASYYEVDRVENQTLTESYPVVVPNLFGWGALSESDYYEIIDHRVDYSLPPSYLFERRNADFQTNINGVLLGGSIGFLISSFIGFVSALWASIVRQGASE